MSPAITILRAQQLALKATCVYCCLTPNEKGELPETIIKGPDKRNECSRCGRLSWEIPAAAASIYSQPAPIQALVAELASAEKASQKCYQLISVKSAANPWASGIKRSGMFGATAIAADSVNPKTVVELGVPGSTRQDLMSIRYSAADVAVVANAEPLPSILDDFNSITSVAVRQAVKKMAAMGYSVVQFDNHSLKQVLQLVKGRQIGPSQWVGIHVHVTSELY